MRVDGELAVLAQAEERPGAQEQRHRRVHEALRRHPETDEELLVSQPAETGEREAGDDVSESANRILGHADHSHANWLRVGSAATGTGGCRDEGGTRGAEVLLMRLLAIWYTGRCGKGIM